MAKFSAELLKKLIGLRLMDKKVKEKCLKEGLASLESVIKSALENLNNLLDSDMERNALSSRYAYAFTITQDSTPEIRYSQPLSEENINKYIELYISKIAMLVKYRLLLRNDKVPGLTTEIDFKIIHDRIQQALNNQITNQSVLENDRSMLETVLLRCIEDYYEHLKSDKERGYLSDLRYQAFYFARLNCPDIEHDKPLSEESCRRFTNEFMDALIKFAYTSSLKRRLG